MGTGTPQWYHLEDSNKPPSGDGQLLIIQRKKRARKRSEPKTRQDRKKNSFINSTRKPGRPSSMLRGRGLAQNHTILEWFGRDLKDPFIPAPCYREGFVSMQSSRFCRDGADELSWAQPWGRGLEREAHKSTAWATALDRFTGFLLLTGIKPFF